MRVRVLNRRKVISSLEGLDKKLTKKREITKTLKRGSTIVEEKAERIVPVDTGALRADIQIGVDDKGVAIFNTLDYAPKIEFAVKPYLRPAVGQFLASIKVIKNDFKRKIK